jgi:hypothetical protein
VYAEQGRFRPIAAFLEDAVAFVHLGGVVTYPVSELDDASVVGSSLYVAGFDMRHVKRPPAT